jgi:hypothetical protein
MGQNEVDLRGHILCAHVFPVEVPEKGFVQNRIQGGVLDTVLAASVIAEPDIVACGRKVESGGSVWRVYDPLKRIGLEAMLHEYSGLLLRGLV